MPRLLAQTARWHARRGEGLGPPGAHALGNMTEWTDDAGAFYERSLGSQLLNGFDLGPEGRPGALYFSSNIRGASGDIDPAIDRGGWLSVSYGEGGNAETLTVHAQCHDADAASACYDNVSGRATLDSGSFTTREDHLRTSCACRVEQHYQYRYDELNRLTEARRYDRDGVAAAGATAGSTWKLAARQRYGYDASNTRRVKETVQTDPADPPDATALYVLPGDLERRGLVRGPDGLTYEASATLGTETQYLVAGARIVWKDRAAPDPSQPLDRDHRITMAMGDLLGSVSCVVDLESGDLIERSTYYPNGARETQQATRNQSLQLEPMGFTGKEADEEVGLVYFGQRYLIPRIARWSTPDPLQIHGMGGGEPFNSYHYISGNLLQATDPVGLECGRNMSCDQTAAPAMDASNEANTTLPNGSVTATPSPGSGDSTHPAARARPEPSSPPSDLERFTAGGEDVPPDAPVLEPSTTNSDTRPGPVERVVGAAFVGLLPPTAVDTMRRDDAVIGAGDEEALRRQNSRIARDLDRAGDHAVFWTGITASLAGDAVAVAPGVASVPDTLRALSTPLPPITRFRPRMDLADPLTPSTGPLTNASGNLEDAALRARTLNPRSSSFNANNLHHIFGRGGHGLEGVVDTFGSRNAAMEAMQNAVQAQVRSGRIAGRFETGIRVGGYNLTVRGRVIDGTARIGTVFIP